VDGVAAAWRREMKFCIHCRFAVKEIDWKCHHRDAAQRELDLVTGEELAADRDLGRVRTARRYSPIGTSD
jgi:hypothetical protein